MSDPVPFHHWKRGNAHPNGWRGAERARAPVIRFCSDNFFKKGNMVGFWHDSSKMEELNSQY
jgi:hypothetical protein